MCRPKLTQQRRKRKIGNMNWITILTTKLTSIESPNMKKILSKHMSSFTSFLFHPACCHERPLDKLQAEAKQTFFAAHFIKLTSELLRSDRLTKIEISLDSHETDIQKTYFSKPCIIMYRGAKHVLPQQYVLVLLVCLCLWKAGAVECNILVCSTS